MTSWLRALAIALALTAIAVGVGVVLNARGPAEPEPVGHTSTPLASYDTKAVAIARSGFCDGVPDEAVTEALGAAADDESAWANGDEVPGTPEVAHEFGCSFTGTAGAEAAAWVFTPPITVDRASDLAEEAATQQGCRVEPDAPAYGDPSVALVCAGPKRTFASYRGLFGDAWLSCSLALPNDVSREALLDRAGRWCVAVAQAASVQN